MITLTHSSAYAVVNPDGAWVETLGDEAGAVLFPKSGLVTPSGEIKARGGMHVCLPNFGPGGDSGLGQHGFGRISTWSVLQQSASTVLLKLADGEKGYEGLVGQLDYQLEPHALTAVLSLTNRGETLLRAAPGFHPYFYLDESETAVSVNNKLYELSELTGTEFITAENISLKTAKQSLTISQHNLSSWAIWTDGLANYVCVEPTYGGYRFLKSSTPDEELPPGAKKTFSCTITWS